LKSKNKNTFTENNKTEIYEIKRNMHMKFPGYFHDIPDIYFFFFLYRWKHSCEINYFQ